MMVRAPVSLLVQAGGGGPANTSDINRRYRSGMVNSNTVNSKFHLIRTFFEILARILSFHV